MANERNLAMTVAKLKSKIDTFGEDVAEEEKLILKRLSVSGLLKMTKRQISSLTELMWRLPLCPDDKRQFADAFGQVLRDKEKSPIRESYWN